MAKKKKSKRKPRHLVTDHLEKVSRGVFSKYQKQVTDMIRGYRGVYALYRRNNLYYIGLAGNLRNRIKSHLKDKHGGSWTHFSLYIFKKENYIRELEALLLRIAYPEGNKQKGKLKGSDDLKPLLKQYIKIAQKKELDDLLKSHRAKSKKKTTTARKARGKKGEKPLKGKFPKGKRLYAKYKGKEFKAWAFRSGTVKLISNGKLYDTPSAAGKVARGGKATNGWVFWKYKNKKGELVRLNTLFRGNKPAKTEKSTSGKKTGTTKDNCPLYGSFPTGKIIYGSYKGQDYKAGVHSNGRIKFNGKYYDTPSKAGEAARKKPTNGWTFWKYKNKKGELVKLRERRK